MKKGLLRMAVLVLTMVFFGSSVWAAELIILKKYPDLKVGFTTQNFLQPLPPSLNNAKVAVDFAAVNGFA